MHKLKDKNWVRKGMLEMLRKISVNLRYILISFAFILHMFLSIEDSSSVCQKLMVSLKLFTRERLYLIFFLILGVVG